MTLPEGSVKVETKAEAEALIPIFKFEKLLNQDQNGRRLTLLGTINEERGIVTLERAAFPSSPDVIANFLKSLTNTTNLGANDVYRWYMSSHIPPRSLSSASSTNNDPPIPDLKLNLIYPCTEAHIKKYTVQKLRYVTETPEIYQSYVKPYIERTQRTAKRLDWIYNILDGITEQEDVVYRSPDFDPAYRPARDQLFARFASGESTLEAEQRKPTGFLLLPDLNWDRKTITSLHLLALIQRRDISSLRDLKRSHIPWLKSILSQIKDAAANRGTELAATSGSSEALDPDQVKCYVHYQPTYYHFHVHVVHVLLEPEGTTQSVGKAFGLEMLIAMLGCLKGDNDPGLNEVDITYFMGEESEIWKKCFGRIKTGERADLLD